MNNADDSTGKSASAKPRPMPAAAKGTWLLTLLILIGLGAGALVGQLLHDTGFDPAVDPDSAHSYSTVLYICSFFGKTIFMGLLKMLIVPLIISSVIAGVVSVGNFRQLGRIGLKTLVYYFATMLIAVTIGLILVNAIQPGRFMADLAEREAGAQAAVQAREATITTAQEKGLIGAVMNIVGQLIPNNPVRDAAQMDVLPMIVFSIFFGVVLTMLGQRGRPVAEFFQIIFEVIMKMVHAVIWLAPLGVFCLLVWTVARIGFESFIQGIGVYMITVIVGLGVHGLIILPIILLLLARVNPFKFLGQMHQALLTAFGTDSSSATLPVTMECAVENGGVSRKAAGFVLPLGATINMDGTALYEAVAVAFLAQVYGLHLGLEQSVIIALTATLAAVGAAGIPEAGLVTMLIVIKAVNDNVLAGDPTTPTIPIEAVGIIIGVDRLLDMCRTTVNVWGDAVGSKIISNSEPDGEAAPAI
jgi:Na+/H+-dicarboxylate symporter